MADQEPLQEGLRGEVRGADLWGETPQPRGESLEIHGEHRVGPDGGDEGPAFVGEGLVIQVFDRLEQALEAVL